MTTCLRTLRRHRGRHLRPGMGGYVIADLADSGRSRVPLAWFPVWCVDGLTARGLVEGGRLTGAGLELIERSESETGG